MTSVVNHIASSAQIALEGYMRYEKALHIIGNYEVAIKVSIEQNFCKFALVFKHRKTKVVTEIKTDTLYSYNSPDMAEATVKFLLCQLLYKVLHSDIEDSDDYTVRELQSLFKYELGIDVAVM